MPKKPNVRHAWTRQPYSKRVYRPSYPPYQGCYDANHAPFFSWHKDCQEYLCGFCNPRLANAEGRYVLEYLHKEAQDALLAEIARKGLNLVDYLLFPWDAEAVEQFATRLATIKERPEQEAQRRAA